MCSARRPTATLPWLCCVRPRAVTNQIIKEALHPYPDELHIVTKVGTLRDAEGGWPQALDPEQLRQAVNDNLENLGRRAPA